MLKRKSQSLLSDENQTKTSKRPSYSPSSKKTGKKLKTKKMRKSSFNKAQKNFAIFHQNLEHENKYENLAIDDNTNSEIDHDDTKEVLIISSESDQESNECINKSTILSVNELDNNEDFIPFNFTSDEEESEEPVNTDNKEVGQSSNDGCVNNREYPWILNYDHSKQREIADWLTLEIKDFISYISPNRQEIEQRNKAIAKLKSAVKKFWKDANLYCFGSYATDLYLPGSDIDCVIISLNQDKENRQSLYSLASYLKRNGLAIQVEVIVKTRVPIIKFIEPDSQIHIDLSFERTNGLEAAKIIRNWLQDTPGLRELVLIVKQFLHARRLNDVHTGGLGGFGIICLVYSFLRLHPRIVTNDIKPLENLGVLLIDFFELYGKNFGYDDVAIHVSTHDARYSSKDSNPDIANSRSRFSLVIQDPGDPTNNITRGSFNLRDIKKAFAGAFDLLTNRCFELDAATFKDRIGESILGNVIKYSGSKRDFKDERDLVVNKAIQENENYHRKRGRIVHDDTFVDLGETDEEYENIYKMRSLKRKQSKRDTVSTPKHPLVEDDTYDPHNSTNDIPIDDMYTPELNINQSSITADDKVSSLMGLNQDNDSDDYNPAILLDNGHYVHEKKTVSKETKRNYWLSKGQSM